MQILLSLLTYILSFILIWFGAGLIISSVEQFSKKLRLSSFAVSFFILGLMTSIPEFAVGMTAVAKGDSEVFVGNLLGGITIIFLLIIPILAIFGKGLKLVHTLDKNTLILTLLVIAAPALLIIDKKVTNLEGVIFIVLYLLLLFIIEKQKGLFDATHSEVMDIKHYSTRSILKIILGIAIVFIASNVIVDKTLYFASVLAISPFYVSLIVLSLGTNAPELSLAIRSIVNGKKEIAFGDYLGSAAANTLLFGIFTLLSHGEVLTEDNFLLTFLFIAGGLTLFYFFSRSKNVISRGEGIVLFLLYVVFVLVELI